jgi:hypothetical protein
MSCPYSVYPSFPCSGTLRQYIEDEDNSSEIYVHRGVIQEEINPPEIEAFDFDHSFYNFLRTLRFVKHIEADTRHRCYVVWVHEDTQLVTSSSCASSRKTSIFALGYHPRTRHDTAVDFEEGARPGGWVGDSLQETNPVPIQHIRELLTREVFCNHPGVSSIQESTCPNYAQQAGPNADDDFYYPVSVRFLFRTYIIYF